MQPSQEYFVARIEQAKKGKQIAETIMCGDVLIHKKDKTQAKIVKRIIDTGVGQDYFLARYKYGELGIPVSELVFWEFLEKI